MPSVNSVLKLLNSIKRRELRVGKRLVNAGGLFISLGGFQDRAAIQTFEVFRVGILGDELRSQVAAG